MASADILRAARARIADPKNWTTGQLARNGRGRPCRGDDPEAQSWCAIGALEAIGADPCGSERSLLTQQSNRLYNKVGVATVNDKIGHEAVLQVFDAAIAAAEAEAGR